MTDDDLMYVEESFDETEHERPRPVIRKRLRKAKKDIFDEIKVKMMMRIYGVSKARALEIIAGREGEKRALKAENDKAGKKGEKDAGEFMSAADFFG